VQADAHTIAVEQMRLGDHAFAHYADDNVRWQVPAVFTQRGLGHGEKVIIMGDPAVSADEAYQRLTAFAGPAEQARARLWLARELSDRPDITGGAGGAIVTLEFQLAVTRRDTPGLASAAAPGGPARR